MSIHEIVLPETKPETEWVRGRALQKVSPKRDHSRLQGALTIALTRWATGRGEVGPEWRFRVAPPGEVRRGVSLHASGSPGIGTLPRPVMIAVTSSIAACAADASVPLATIDTPLPVDR